MYRFNSSITPCYPTSEDRNPCLRHNFRLLESVDTLKHSSVTSKLSCLDIPDNIYNWVINYLTDRQHCTKLQNSISTPCSINASIVQGSALGPTLFNISSSDLKPKFDYNAYFKYADDGNLVVPGSKAASIPAELEHHATWASDCNLKLNLNKTSEIVFTRPRSPMPPPNIGIEKKDNVKMLGVYIDNKLKFDFHVSETPKNCSKSLFALKVMKTYGMQTSVLDNIFKSLILSKLLYASPAWWGFISIENKNKIQAFLNRATRWGYYKSDGPSISVMQEKIDKKLFLKIIQDESHVLHYLLPEVKQPQHSLRPRGHNFSLPDKDMKNFIIRCLYLFR